MLRPSLALDNGLRAAGLTPEQAAAVRDTPPPQITSVRAEDPDEIDTSKIATATIINILLFIMLQTYGQWVLQGVTREKASRVVEVLLAMITPRQLLIGKIVGIGIVALDPRRRAHRGGAGDVARDGRRPRRAASRPATSRWRRVWFVLGYSLYCSAYAAAGSLVSRVEDGQSVAFPIMLPLLFGYIVSFSAAGGASTLLWVLAFFPPTAVVAMPTLYAIGAAEPWMVLVSMALTVVAIVIVAIVASKMYERSVLHSGRKMSWKDALRSQPRDRRLPAPPRRRRLTGSVDLHWSLADGRPLRGGRPTERARQTLGR